MAVGWAITVDCRNARAQAEFWALALGYVPAPPPEGFASWEAWLTHFEVPETEWDDGAALVDPEGHGPSVTFLAVPEPKTTKNRWHVDVRASGGRHVPWEQRWSRVTDMVERLVAAGATELRTDITHGRPDHVVLADREGHEFCGV